MPDFGLTKAAAKGVLEATKKGAKGAEVKRPGQDKFLGKPPEEEVVPDQIKTQADPKPDNTLAPEVETPDIDVEQEALAVTTKPFDQFKLDESFQTNFDTIETTDEVKAVIASVAEKNAASIDEARRGTITSEQLQGLAADLDMDTDVVGEIMTRESGGTLNAETILAARQVLNSSADRVFKLANKINVGEATDIEKLQFRRQIQFHREYQTQFMGARAEAGRALNAFKIPTGVDEAIDPARIKELIDGVDGHSTEQVAAAIVLTDGSVPAVSKLARKYTQSKITGVVNENFVNSILSGPRTHEVNAGGNILMQVMGIAETSLAARIGKFLPGPEHIRIGEAAAMMHGTIGAFKDALILAARSFRTGTSLDDAMKFETTRRRSISAEHLLTPEQRATPLGRFAEGLLDGIKIPTKYGGSRTVVPGVGPIIRFPTERVMAPTDEFFKTLAYRAELERQAFKHAYDQVASGAIEAADAARVAREFLENAPLKARTAAEQYTRYVTFQNPLGERGSAFQMALRKSPVTTLLAPFVRTPVNIFTAGILDRSPLALFRAKFWETMKAGGRERDMMLSRVSLGTATTAAVASFVVDGSITGAGPSNPEARAALEAGGWQPYSIRVPNDDGSFTYHSYARMEPWAFVVGATADATETLAYINSDSETLQDEERKVNDAIASVVIGIANNTMSKTYVKGIADFTEMMSDPSRYFQGWFKNFAAAQIPFSALRRQAAQIDDPYMREAWSVLDNLKVNSGIPGWSAEAPPRRDIYGSPRMHHRGSILGAMSPMPERTDKADPINDQVVALMNLTRRVPITMPAKRMEGLRLTTEEYDQIVRTSRLEPMPNGYTFREYLDRLFNSGTYQLATPDFKVDLIKEAQSMYDQHARDTLYRENTQFQLRLDSFTKKRDELKFGD